MSTTVFRFPAPQYRAMKPPVGSTTVGIFYVNASKVPADLIDWRDVNPREIKKTTAVYKDMVSTLLEESDKFHERNRGITIVADSIKYDDKAKTVVVEMSDKKYHGVIDGGHTLQAILDAQKNSPEGWSAHVYVKALCGIDKDQIAEIAGGLNTSQQVDLKSLENLKEHFEDLKKSLSDQPYSNSIAYKMNEKGAIDVRDVLQYLAVFDCDKYSDKKHPSDIFGRKEAIVREFAKQADVKKASGDSFKRLITKAPEILKLRDQLEKEVLKQKGIGRYNSGKNTRIRGDGNRNSQLVFLDETIDGKIPLGWIMPMLGAFRANVDWDSSNRTFKWIEPVDELLSDCVEDLFLNIADIHERENSRPEYVGRNAMAWRACYSSVNNAILVRRLARSEKR